jgi:hypothetical protein
VSEKIPCKDAKVSGVADARQWAGELVKREARGPGDMEPAMRRLESKYGIPWRLFWSLRYRPPSYVKHGIWEQLRQAYRAECERQMRLLKHELEITKAIAGPDAPAVRASEALVDAADET